MILPLIRSGTEIILADAFLSRLFRVLGPGVLSDIINTYGFALHGIGNGLVGIYRSFVEIFVAQARAKSPAPMSVVSHAADGWR